MSKIHFSTSTASRDVAPNFLDIGSNPEGLDYFVGDIHGEGRLLAHGLRAIGFDFGRDRLIATGDLVNRGRDHRILLEGIIPRVRNFYSVLGNHDIACIELIRDILDRGWTSPYVEAEWLRDLSISDQHHLCEFLNRLPLAIAVTLRDGQRVGVIHADFPSEMIDFQSMHQVSTSEWPFCREGTPLYSALLGRGRIHLLNALRQPPPSPRLTPHIARRQFEQPADMDLMICGHSYCPGLRPVQLYKWLFLDTGAGTSPEQLEGAALSIFEPLGRRVVQAFHYADGDIGTTDYALEKDCQLPGEESGADNEN